jgi:hypothetical protein
MSVSVRSAPERKNAMLFLAALLVLWIVLAVIGFTFKTLLWLAFIALALFVITGIGGVIHVLGKRP